MKSSAQLAKPGTLASSNNLMLLNASMTLIHPTKHPSAMSKNPILSPSKNLFPLLQLWKAPSKTTKPSSTSPMAAFLASSSSAAAMVRSFGYHCTTKINNSHQKTKPLDLQSNALPLRHDSRTGSPDLINVLNDYEGLGNGVLVVNDNRDFLVNWIRFE
nr:hypothetical protein Iba_chr07cCG14490 [Ipomoea batatas]